MRRLDVPAFYLPNAKLQIPGESSRKVNDELKFRPNKQYALHNIVCFVEPYYPVVKDFPKGLLK